MRDGEPWFVLADVCAVLGLTNPREVSARLDGTEKNTVSLADGSPGNPRTTLISESGLYFVIMRSDKPDALRFQRWITREVLPSIR